MPSFGLRGLILVAIAAILIFRTIRKFGAGRSGRIPTPARAGSAGNAFCIHCGASLAIGGLFCGGCGARRN
jgi:hypothetical protein